MRAALAALVLGLAGPALAAPDDGVRIGAVRAHLFYERSGQLSDDLLARGRHAADYFTGNIDE